MPLVGAVAAPHSHLQLFTRPAETDQYKRDVQKGRNAMFALREEVEQADADTILLVHNDHFVNFDFRCYPPFALFVGQEAKGSGVTDPATIESITGATYRKYEGKGRLSVGAQRHTAAYGQLGQPEAVHLQAT